MIDILKLHKFEANPIVKAFINFDLFSDRTHFQCSLLPRATQTTQNQIHPHAFCFVFLFCFMHTDGTSTSAPISKMKFGKGQLPTFYGNSKPPQTQELTTQQQ